MMREQDEYFENPAATGCRCGDMPGYCPGVANCPLCQMEDEDEANEPATYSSLQEAADDLLSDEELATMDIDRLNAAILKLNANLRWPI